MKTILIAAGGTGGHIIPALSVAKYLQNKSVQVHWLGTSQGLEHQLIPPTGIPIHYVAMQGVRKKNWQSLIAAPWRIVKATLQAMRVIKAHKISVVAGFGGFVSLPAGIAAMLLRVPLVIQEQNAAAGLSSRLLSRFAKQICLGFPDTFSNPRVIFSGNPVRDEITSLPPPEKRFENRQGALRLLILGGSQGASFFNQSLPQAIAKLPPDQRPDIVHVAGKRFATETQALYAELGIKQVRVMAFIADMENYYAWADLAICRAGALTVSELAALGLASILVPYPYAVDDHQSKNAAWLAKVGAAIVVPQQALSIEKCQELLLTLNNRNVLLKMAMAGRSVGKSNATGLVSDACLQWM